MKKNSVRTAHLAVAVAIALLATGCAGGGAGDGTTVLHVYGWKGTPTEPANVAEINAAFEAAHPDITVQYEVIQSGAAYTTRVSPELLAGTAADVLMVDSGLIEQYTQSGYLADLSDQEWASQIRDDVKPYVTIDSSVYAAPLELVPIGLYANMDILAEVGVTTFPTTLSEFKDDLDALDAAGLPGLSLANKNGWTAQQLLSGIASTLVYSDNPSWDDEFDAGKVSFSDWSESIDQVLALDSEGYVDWKLQLGVDEWGQGIEDFKAGNAAFIYQGAWNLDQFLVAGVNVQFGVWPATDRVSRATVFSGVDFALNSAAKSPDAAKAYIEFWTQAATLEGFLEKEHAASPYTDGTAPVSDATTVMSEALNADNFRILAGTTGWYQGENVTTMEQKLQALFLGSISKEDLIATFDGFRIPS